MYDAKTIEYRDQGRACVVPRAAWVSLLLMRPSGVRFQQVFGSNTLTKERVIAEPEPQD